MTIGTAIEDNRQNLFGINAGGGRVHHKFTDGNVDTVRTPVTDTEDFFRIGYDNETNIFALCPASQGLFNLRRFVNRQKDGILRIYKKFTVFFNIFGNNRIVHNRHEFDYVFAEHLIEQGAIRIKQLHEKTPLFNTRILAANMFVRLPGLLFKSLYMRR